MSGARLASVVWTVAVLLAGGATARAAGPTRLDLGGSGWQLHPADRPGDVTPATVPGCVDTDLMAAGRLPADPFFRTNESQFQVAGTTAWVYARHFTVPADLLARGHVELRCDGLETLAHVRVNGRPAGDADNMFRTWRFDVRPLLHVGDNTVEVAFDPLKPYIAAKVAAAKGKGRLLAVNGMGEVRVEPCCNGWDFGPKFVTYGIWRPIALVAWDGGRIRAVGVGEDLSDPHAARLTVALAADMDGTAAVGATATVSIGGRAVASAKLDVAADGTGRATLTVPDPQRWWPNGMGGQPMYDVSVDLTADGRPVDRISKRVGLRTVALEPRSADHALRLVVNGRPIYAKGANWIPCHVFPTAVTRDRLRGLVADARDAHMNVLRCWGGGYYEEDAFFDACDEMGLLVWSEFKFACSAYPLNDPAFTATVAAEATDQLERLRHHPSIAVWSGNNEVRAIVEHYGVMNEAEYDRLFHQLLGGRARDLSPQTPYVGGSPEAGDEHNWWVWHVGAPFEKYLDGHGWMTEFGFQSFPEPRTVAAFTDPADRTSPESPVMKFHQRNGNGRGNAMVTEMMGRYFRPARDFESALWLSQINQAMGISLGVRHWRADWPHSTGSLVWQLDEIWPGPTWSCVDYFGRPKAVMYTLRHDYAPVVIDGHADERTGAVTVDVASDAPAAVDARLRWTLTDLAGRVVEQGTEPVRVPAGTAAARAWSHPFDAALEHVGRRNALLWLDLSTAGGDPLSTQTVRFAKPKRLELMDPHLTAAVRPAGDGFDVTVAVDHPALYAWLDLGVEARYGDNFVDVAPGHPVTVHVTPAATMSVDAFRASLTARSLFDTYDPATAGDAGKPIVQAADGSFVATAATADIVGDSPVLETGEPPNIGGWSDARDSLRWAVHVTRPGTFRVAAVTALPGRGPPRAYTVSVGDRHVDGTVPRTAAWTDYRSADVGLIAVDHPGDVIVTLRPVVPAEPLGGGFMNFRSLTFAPAAGGH